MSDQDRNNQRQPAASYSPDGGRVFDPEADHAPNLPGGKRGVGSGNGGGAGGLSHGLPRPGDPYPFDIVQTGDDYQFVSTGNAGQTDDYPHPTHVIDPEAPGYDPAHFLPGELRGLGGAFDPGTTADEDETDADAELRAALRAEEVWKARLGVTGPQAEERERLKALRLVVGTGRAKPPQADPTSYEEHEQRRREIEEKLERERARRKRNRGR